MNAETFQKEFLPYHQKLYRIAFRFVRNKEIAEDLVQEAYMKLWEKRSKMNEVKNKESFIIIVLRNQCLDYMKSVKKQELFSLSDFDMPVSSAMETIELNDEADFIRRLINGLPDQYRIVLTLKDWDGCPVEEIEQITGLTVNNIRVILSRSRKYIREQYQKMVNNGN